MYVESVMDHVDGNQEGLFLVRESSSSPGDYVLSLIHDNTPIHYQIRRYGEDAFFSIDDGPIVHGLEMLISYYQEDAQGLSTKLGHMCKAQPPPPDSRRHGRTNLLHRATKEGELTVVTELLKSGYHNLDAKNQEGQTAVHLASIAGFDDILDLLLKNAANPNIIDGNGLTPLHYACLNNKPSTVVVLIHYRANPQLRATETGWVPLHYAAFHGYTDVVQMLLSLNCPCHPRSNYNETPSDLAMKNNHKDCLSLLRNHIPHQPCSSRSSWFHENVDREKAVQLLQSRGFKDGMFLVRRSTRKKDIYVLTVAQNSHPFHYEIQCEGIFYFIDDGPYLESLEHIIDYYSRMADGLPTNLVHAVAPETTVSLDVEFEPRKELMCSGTALQLRKFGSSGLTSSEVLEKLAVDDGRNPSRQTIDGSICNGLMSTEPGQLIGTKLSFQMNHASICGTMMAAFVLDATTVNAAFQSIPGAIFQQDNARPHVAKTVRDFCSTRHFQLLPWFAYSLDMSPIEDVWDLVGWRLAHNPRPAASKDELLLHMQAVWNFFPQADIQNLFDSMPRHVATLIAASGGYFKY
ncbi:tyrosine-protein kinase Shark [Trichonephila clavipes]|nr:tyrosine-protein kinase Shark [Trichonephila clavipes]